ncbi:MAG: LysM peptidoglycan-binding domain-containing protein [Phycisphaeraceae bacterium]|nr:LysM peptidoglycan-binding domain-containing protein [Phycisphaeraceae bacterium]
MKVHYKIALVAAVVLFTVVSGYFLTQDSANDTTVTDADSANNTSTQETDRRPTSGNINLVPLTSKTNNKDLNSLVREQLAAINKPSASTHSLLKPPPPPKPTTMTFNGKPINNLQKPKPTPARLTRTNTPNTSTPTPPVIRTTTPTSTRKSSLAARPLNYPTRYTIQPGDTLSSIALTLYGSDRHWVEIAQANPTIDPLKLKPNQEINLPQPSELRRPSNQKLVKSSRGNNSQYTVRAGDNLSTIAQEFYKNSALWRRIYNANKSKIGTNPDTLQAGVTLDIPPVTSGSGN